MNQNVSVSILRDGAPSRGVIANSAGACETNVGPKHVTIRGAIALIPGDKMRIIEIRHSIGRVRSSDIGAIKSNAQRLCLIRNLQVVWPLIGREPFSQFNGRVLVSTGKRGTRCNPTKEHQSLK